MGVDMLLYECGWLFNIRGILPWFLLIVICTIGFKKTRRKGRATQGIAFYCLLFAVLVTMIVLFASPKREIRVVGQYKSGNYSVVEGEVENFDPMPWEGHKHESFDIDGVHFHYSDYESIPSYHKSLSHGGVIVGDGQRLRIKYVVYGSKKRNLICCIEELD